MSGIAGLFNVPGDQRELDTWSFLHMVHHRDINRAIYELAGVTLAEYVLDPFNPEQPQQWLYLHQEMHKIQDLLLGIDGYNLTNVDFRNPGARASWILLNAQEHRQAADILEIG